VYVVCGELPHTAQRAKMTATRKSAATAVAITVLTTEVAQFIRSWKVASIREELLPAPKINSWLLLDCSQILNRTQKLWHKCDFRKRSKIGAAYPCLKKFILAISLSRTEHGSAASIAGAVKKQLWSYDLQPAAKPYGVYVAYNHARFEIKICQFKCWSHNNPNIDFTMDIYVER